jgi:hypothetical protein
VWISAMLKTSTKSPAKAKVYPQAINRNFTSARTICGVFNKIHTT